MPVPVIMPKLEMSQEAATLVEWRKQEGQEVEQGEPLFMVETDKVTVDVEAPATGILAGVRAQAGQRVPVTEVIAYILQPGEVLPAGPAAPAPPSAITPAPAPAGRPAATPLAERVAQERGLDLSQVVGTGPGGRVTRADVEAAQAKGVRATPAARRLARERGLDLGAIAGSGPRGRVQAGDVAAHALEGAEMREEVVPLAGMRRTIAERLTASWQAAPHVTFTVPVDMGAFEAARAQLNLQAEAAGAARVSATALIVKAVAWALRQHPWLNSSLQADGIHLWREVNVGVAVALREGLIVPVVHRADRKGVAEIAAEVNDLSARAREGRLVPADVAGGTFTVSNLGPFGVEQFTAIINPPQAAILAVGAMRPEAVVDGEGHIVARPLMRMTLVADHRIVDGAQAAQFLADLKRALEAPAVILW